jgi:hypothetical protein
MKQETIEEAAERLSKDAYKKHSVKDNNLSLDEQIQRIRGFIVGFKEGMNEGAKWQAERRYSEEEVYKLLLKHQSDYRSSVRNSYPLTWSFDIKDWFEQFKKK